MMNRVHHSWTVKLSSVDFGDSFVASGARVRCLNLRGEEVPKEATKLSGGALFTYDVADEASATSAVDGLIKSVGGVDIPVKNVGMSHAVEMFAAGGER